MFLYDTENDLIAVLLVLNEFIKCIASKIENTNGEYQIEKMFK